MQFCAGLPGPVRVAYEAGTTGSGSRGRSRRSAPSRSRPPTLAFLGWFGPRGLVSIVFAVIVVEESNLPHEHLIVLAIYLTVGLSVFAHGLSALPLADRYARWYEQHPRDNAPPMESAPTDVTRARGAVAQPAEVT